MASNMAAKTVNLSNFQGFYRFQPDFFMDNYKIETYHYSRCNKYLRKYFIKIKNGGQYGRQNC